MPEQLSQGQRSLVNNNLQDDSYMLMTMSSSYDALAMLSELTLAKCIRTANALCMHVPANALVCSTLPSAMWRIMHPNPVLTAASVCHVIMLCWFSSVAAVRVPGNAP